MKVNSAYNADDLRVENNELYLQLNDYFLKFLQDAPEYSETEESFLNGDFKYNLDSLSSFCREKYIHFSPHLDYEDYSELLEKIFNIEDLPKNLISENEIDLLRLMFGDSDNDVSIILGKVGYGKSTLIKYVLKYLLNYKKINLKFIPIHIDFDLYVNNLNLSEKKDEGINLLNKLIINKILKINKNIIQVDNNNFWDYIKSKEAFSLFRIKEEAILKTSSTLKDDIEKYRFDLITKREVILSSLTYIKEIFNNRIILFIDNLDPINYNHTQVIMNELYKIVKLYKIKAIVSLRPNTYSEIYTKQDGLNEALTHKTSKLIKPHAQYIFESKLKLLKQSKDNKKLRISLNNQIFDSASVYELIKSFVYLLQSDDVTLFLNNICNGNIRTWNKALRMYFSSGHLKSHRLYSNYLNSKLYSVNEIKYNYNPNWIAFYSIITSNYKLYFPSYESDVKKDLVINIFNNKKLSINSVLIRLHILQFYLNETTQLSTLRRIYKEVFNDIDSEQIDISINYAIKRMVNGGLLGSDRVYKIASDDLVSNIKGLSIEDSGRYYYYHLIGRFEYLKFMKDDVHLPNSLLSKIKGAHISYSISESFKEILYFLDYLLNEEFKILIKLDKDKLVKYINNFTPESIYFFSAKALNSIAFYTGLVKEIRDSEGIKKQIAKILYKVEKYHSIVKGKL